MVTKAHRHLTKRHKWYAHWHKSPLAEPYHWMLLIIFSLFTLTAVILPLVTVYVEAATVSGM